jgi:hypothetical protein
MFTTAVILSLVSTLAICTVAIYIKWVIVHVGATVFAMLLLVMSMIFLLVLGDKKYGK